LKSRLIKTQERPKIIVSALIEKDGKLLLVKEVLEDSKEYWILPGGKVEFGETLADAVKREIKEETNLDIEISKFVDFEEAIHIKHKYHTIIFFFAAKPLNEDLVLERKVLEARFFSKDELRKLNLVDSAKSILEKFDAQKLK
jgi:8-oxo-dGTP diphosphatase